MSWLSIDAALPNDNERVLIDLQDKPEGQRDIEGGFYVAEWRDKQGRWIVRLPITSAPVSLPLRWVQRWQRIQEPS